MSQRLCLSFGLALGLVLGFARPALAADSAAAGEAGARATDDAPDSGAPEAGINVPLACGGALCDTTNGSTCSLSHRLAPAGRFPTALTLGVAWIVMLRRRDRSRRRS